MIATLHASLPEKRSLSRHVQDNEKISEASCFIDVSWDFKQEVRAPNAKKKIYWEKISFHNETVLTDICNHKFYVTLKEFAFSRIFKSGATFGCRSVKIQTVIDDILCLSSFARWLVIEGKSSFSEATQRDIDRFIEWLKNSERRRGKGSRSKAYVVRALIPIPLLWLHKNHVDHGITFSPWNGRTVTRVLNYQNAGENRTEIIPEEMMQPLYQLSMKLIQSDVIDPLIQVLRQAPTPRLLNSAISKNEKEDRAKTFYELRKQLKRHHLFVGSDRYGPTYYYRTWKVLEVDVGIVYAAFTVIIAGLSAMRDSEVRSLGPKAATIEYDSAGQPKTYKITGRTFKNASEDISDELGGEKRTWVVIEEVYNALVALEEFATADPAFDQIRLFSRFGANNTVNINLRRLLALAKNSDGSPVIREDGNQWQLKSSQFRRSLARWIVWQPFGIIAGKNLFGHARIATTQGYAASDPSWNKLVAKEEAALIDAVMTDLAFDVSEGAVTGIKSKEILELLGTAGDRRFDDVLFYLKHNKKNFHVGPYSYCFYDPDRAACKSFAPADKPPAPVTSSCSPDRCANACISRRHLPAWQILASDLGSMLRTKGLNEAQKQALKRERTRIESIITPLLNETSASSQDDTQEG